VRTHEGVTAARMHRDGHVLAQRLQLLLERAPAASGPKKSSFSAMCPRTFAASCDQSGSAGPCEIRRTALPP
jgi:hypothetical protein